MRISGLRTTRHWKKAKSENTEFAAVVVLPRPALFADVISGRIATCFDCGLAVFTTFRLGFDLLATAMVDHVRTRPFRFTICHQRGKGALIAVTKLFFRICVFSDTNERKGVLGAIVCVRLGWCLQVVWTTFDDHMMPWHSFVVLQSVTGIMLPVAQVVGAPTRTAYAAQERGTSALPVRDSTGFRFSNLTVRLSAQCFR